jgi:hypothetical protein
MKPYSTIIAFMLGLLFTAGCSDENRIIPPPDSEPDTLEITFQDGVHPTGSYFGTRDAVLKDGPIPELIFGNFGAATDETLGVVYIGSGYYERRLLLRMDLSGLAGCSAVIDARLSLRIESDLTDSLVLDVYGAAVPAPVPSWIEGTGGMNEGVSWYAADGATVWSNPGGDFVYPLLDEQTVRADSVVAFSLPGALVLNWIRNPSTNHGVLIKARDTDGERYVLVHLRESGTGAFRPKLELLYFKSG